MARMKYLGPADPVRIPGIGPVGKEWVVVPDRLAREFEHDKDFQVEFDVDQADRVGVKNGNAVASVQKKRGDK